MQKTRTAFETSNTNKQAVAAFFCFVEPNQKQRLAAERLTKVFGRLYSDQGSSKIH